MGGRLGITASMPGKAQKRSRKVSNILDKVRKMNTIGINQKDAEIFDRIYGEWY
jgi:hypothetical protein